LKTIPIPRFGDKEEKKVEELVCQSMDLEEKAKSIYLQAEQLILSEIGWDNIDLSQPKWWEVNQSQSEEVHRVDAEHFQPRYYKLEAHLKKTKKTKPLGEIAPFIKRGLQPEYVESGEIIVVNSQHLGRYFLNVEATERTDRNFLQKNKRTRLQKNDVLLYSTGAYVGRTNTWLEDQDGVASNHVTIIRPNLPCNSLYLAVFLNTPIGLLQTSKWASGSGQREIYPGDIQRFLIYLPSDGFQEKVADLVTQSYQARQKAKALLDEAKTKIEKLIDG
jgi:restriction endonuclease S subunit